MPGQPCPSKLRVDFRHFLLRFSESLCFCFCLFAISWAAPSAYGGSQARGRIGAVATGLRHSHSHVGSEPRLQPTPQLTATPDPEPPEQGQGSNPQPHGSSLDSLTTEPQRELHEVVMFCENTSTAELSGFTSAPVFWKTLIAFSSAGHSPTLFYAFLFEDTLFTLCC